MGYALGAGSKTRLVAVHPSLVTVVRKAIAITSVDFVVVCGLRSLEEQRAILARGNSGTLRSLHLLQPSGFAEAVDLAPVQNGVVLWKDLDGFQAIADAMFSAADSLGTLIQWGADWDMDGVRDDRDEFAGKRPIFDMPHFQVPREWNREQAKRAQEARCAMRGKP